MHNPIREALSSGRRLFGTHINLTDSRVCEMVGMLGFDYIWIDMEHISTDFRAWNRISSPQRRQVPPPWCA